MKGLKRRLLRGLFSLLLVSGLAADAGAVDLEEGDVVFADAANRAILRYSPATGETDVIASLEVGSGEAPFFNPGDVALGADDALYHRQWPHLIRTDPRTGNRRLLEDAIRPHRPLEHALAHSPHTRELFGLSFEAVFRLEIDGSPPVPLSDVSLLGPGRKIAVGADALFVAWFSGTLTIPLAGGAAEDWGDAQRMEDIAVAPDGTVYVIDSNLPGTIYRVPAGADASELVEITGANRGAGPTLSAEGTFGARSLIAGPDGILYATAWGNPGRLFRVDIDTGDRTLLLSIPNEHFQSGFGGGFVVMPGDVPLDDDGDGIANGLDNCPLVPNPGQEDFDGDGIGDACNQDRDGDEVGDALDNCPDVSNPQQEDFDVNGVGDACNEAEDPDGDEIADELDNCPAVGNPDQSDFDGNGVGDDCNDFEDRDGDDLADDLDNCPDDFDPTQADGDGDGVEDVCDPFPTEPDNEKGQCFVDLDACRAVPPFIDDDGDGEHDPTDRCPETPAGAAVDDAGCSEPQFCGAFDTRRWLGRLGCIRADWRNDGFGWRGDCRLRRLHGSRGAFECVPRRR